MDSIAVENLGEHMELLVRNIAEAPLHNALSECRKKVLEAVAANYARKSSPSGSAWPPRKRQYPWPMLVKTGLMRGASVGSGPGHISRVRHSSDERALEVGVDLGAVPYAAIHDQGTGRMPQREYLGADDKTLDDCAEVIATELLMKL